VCKFKENIGVKQGKHLSLIPRRSKTSKTSATFGKLRKFKIRVFGGMVGRSLPQQQKTSCLAAIFF